MRIILSRKGFDSAAGGCPSPLLDGRPISLPIPTQRATSATYGDLCEPIPEMVGDLTKGRVNSARRCHVDPDIDKSILSDRPAGWRGAFGQVGIAQKHLANQGVKNGDLFLFWGLFRPVEKTEGKWRYFGKPIHAIYGWLQIGDIVHNPGGGPLAKYPWLNRHPHVQDGWGNDNVIYIASDALTPVRPRSLPGFGVFQKAYQLTAVEGPTKSIWRVPDWLHIKSGGIGMSYHLAAGRWLENGTIRTAAKGQEFVTDISQRPDALDWAVSLIEGHR
jgi:hypothetical protein